MKKPNDNPVLNYSKDELLKLDKDVLCQLILNLQNQRAQNIKESQVLNEKVDKLLEIISSLNNNRFGRKTEKLETLDDKHHQIDVFEYLNEPEKLLDTVYVVENPDVDAATTPVKQGKKVGKRAADLRGIKSIVIEHPLSDGELNEKFGENGWKSLPDEVYKRLHYIPSSVYVEEHHVKVYAGKDNQTIIKGKRPKDLLSNSLATPSMVAGVMDEKYTKHVPLYRQEQDFNRKGINISRQVMASWIIRCHERYLSLFYKSLKDELIKLPLLQADETVVEVTKDGRPAGSESRMWVYRSGKFSDKSIILYDYQKTREYTHLKNFLEGFKGVLVSDGYSAYEKLDKEHDDITMAACWAHARRRFSEAEKAIGSKKKTLKNQSIAHKALEKIAKFYKIEGELKDSSNDERLKIRREKIKPLVEEFFDWIRSVKGSAEVLPNGKTAKGIDYCLNYEKYLKTFLDDAGIPIDNNATEQALRGFCVGRNNWKIIDSISGAQASAAIYSIIETAKANGLVPYRYLEHLLTVLSEAVEDTDLDFMEDLFPWSDKIPKECRIEN